MASILVGRPARKKDIFILLNNDDDEVAALIVDAAVDLHRSIGPGMLEAAYEAMLEYDLRERGLYVQRQIYAPMKYKKLHLERAYRIDLLVNKRIIVEIKSAEAISAVHIRQILTYLKLMNLHIGLLLNFGQLTLKAGGIRRIMNGYAPQK